MLSHGNRACAGDHRGGVPAPRRERGSLKLSERLGLRTTTDGRLIEAAIALRAIPHRFADAPSIWSPRSSRARALSYGVFTQDGEGPSRFPASGWLDGSVEDLADLVRLVSVPQHAVESSGSSSGRRALTGPRRSLRRLAELRPFVAREIAELLGMTNVRQTWRMAGAIVANALIFQESTHRRSQDRQVVGRSVR